VEVSRTLKSVSLEGGYHYVYGVVYSPLQVDTDWETMTQADIVKMAHEFLAEGRTTNIDVMHDNQVSGAAVVESFIARKGDPDYPEGAWVLGVRIPEGPLWEAVQKGVLNGFSVEASVLKVPKKVLVDLVRIALGETEMSTAGEIAPHKHHYYLEFDANGVVTLGVTDEVLGHIHQIGGTTATDLADGHSHRFFVE